MSKGFVREAMTVDNNVSKQKDEILIAKDLTVPSLPK